MRDKISKDGTKIIATEYDVREIDQYGDTFDIDHSGGKADAMKAAKGLINRGAIAVVVEKHTSRRPAHLFAEPDTFTTVAVFGDKKVLDLWGWQPGSSTWTEGNGHE
jgi:hypothetical protein